MLELDLPFPVPLSQYYSHTKQGRKYITNKGVKYRKAVVDALNGCQKQTGMLAMFVVMWPKDRRRRDLDNHAGKALLDALKHAGAYDDDSQIVALSSRWEIEGGEIKRHPEGLIHIRIVQAGG